MNLIDKIANRLGYARKNGGVRQYHAAKVNRLTNDWLSTQSSANKEIRQDLKTLRSRSRQLERDNDYVRRWLRCLENNVLGSEGILLQAKSRDANGRLDEAANRIIETAWAEWGESPSVNGLSSWRDVQRIVLRSVARDGCILIRKVRNYDNASRFAIQLLEADLLDHDRTGKMKGGNRVRMGVEIDKWEKPVAYHIFNGHEGDDMTQDRPNKIERIPAEEIIHVFMPERAHQSQGVPWCASAMSGLNQLDAYSEAELVSARIGASKMGFYIKNESGDGYQGETDSAGNMLSEAEAGSFEQLPAGVDFKMFDPDHPSGNYGTFVKATLRGIAGGLGISYNTLSNDLEGVNYSSIRAGLLEEREEYKVVQNWMIDHVVKPIFSEWLEYALLSGSLKLPAAKVQKFNAAEWRARRWTWVDPLKDTNASILAIENGLKSRRRVIAEQGGDIEETLDEMREDRELAKSKGLAFPFPGKNGNGNGRALDLDSEQIEQESDE